MSVPFIIKALHGNYKPTGAYSFEFRRVPDRGEAVYPAYITHSIMGTGSVEVFLLLPPEGVSVSEPQRSQLLPTLTGGYLVDFGADFKQISITGSTHFYYAGSPRKAASEGGNLVGNDFIDGFTEFYKLRFMLSRYRDYTMTPDGKLLVQDLLGASLAGLQSFKYMVFERIESGEGALANQIEMIWHDYDYDDHYKVKIDQLQLSRSKSDPWTVEYTIQMIGYEVDSVANRNLKFRKPTMKKIPAYDQLRKVLLFTGDVAPATQPGELPYQIKDGVGLITNYNTRVEQASTITPV